MKSFLRGVLASLALAALPAIGQAASVQVNQFQSAEVVYDLSAIASIELTNFQWSCATTCPSDPSQALNPGGSFASSVKADGVEVFSQTLVNSSTSSYVGTNAGLVGTFVSAPIIKIRFDYVDDVFTIDTVDLRFWILDGTGARVSLESYAAAEIRAVALSAVPLPAGGVLLISALVGSGCLVGRRRKRATI